MRARVDGDHRAGGAGEAESGFHFFANNHAMNPVRRNENSEAPNRGQESEKALICGESVGIRRESEPEDPNSLGVKRSQVQILSPRLVGAGRPFSFVDGWRGDGTLQAGWAPG